MLNNKARIMVLSLLLSGCGGAGGSFSSASVSNSAQIITRTYQLNHGSGDWFSSKWAYIDGETSVGKVYQDSSMSPDQDTSDQLIKVIIADDAPSVPKQVTIKKDTDFSFKIPSLAIAKGNKLTLAGTKDSSVGIDVLALQGELIVSSGKIDLTGNIEVSQEGVIRDETAAKDGVVFSASSAQKGKVILDGTFDGNLTLPENFTLKTSLGGRITGDLVSDGILQLVAGKTLNVGGVFTNNGDVIIDLSGQSPSKTPLLKSAGDINLRSGGITVKGGKKGIYAIFETDGKIVSKSDNLGVNNGEVVIQTSQTYSLDIKNPSAKFMEGQS